MKKIKFLVAPLLAIAIGVAHPIRAYAAPVQYFYTWQSPAEGFWGFADWMDQLHTSCMVAATFDSPGGVPRKIKVEAYGIRNDTLGTKVTFADYTMTNTHAACAFGPVNPFAYTTIKARILVNSGTYGDFYATGYAH